MLGILSLQQNPVAFNQPRFTSPNDVSEIRSQLTTGLVEAQTQPAYCFLYPKWLCAAAFGREDNPHHHNQQLLIIGLEWYQPK